MAFRLGIDASNLRGGGGLTHLREFLRAADPALHDFDEIIVWGGHKTLKALTEHSDSVTLEHHSRLDGSLLHRLLWRQFDLPRVSRSCDLVFVPGGLQGPPGVPWVTMSRNMLPFEKREKRRYPLGYERLRLEVLKRAQARAFERADGLIFLTEYAQEQIESQLRKPPSKTKVIPHGIGDRFFLPPRRATEASGGQNSTRLLYVSTVNAYKHQWIVAEAVSKLREEGWPLELDLIGGGYEPALTRLEDTCSRLDPEKEWLHYHGNVPFEALHDYYQSADLFIFASSCENMPNILLEAMAAGLPIACSNRGPMPEILGSAGQYFDPESADTICDAVRSALKDDPLREKMAIEGFERAKNYSWSRCASETFEFLHSVHAATAGHR